MDVRDIRELLSEYEIKFIRLAFCDISGIQKNIAIMADEFEHAVTHGVSFDASAIKGFLNVNESDLLLFPDLDTFSILPWRPSDRAVARFYCYITYPDRRPFEGDGRYLLSEIEKRSGQAGYSFLVGPECEFYLFETDDKGFPTLTPFDEAEYFDMAPLDRGENVRREICFALEKVGTIRRICMWFITTKVARKSEGVRQYWTQQTPASMTVEEAKNFNFAAVVEVDGAILDNPKVTYTYKKKGGFLGLGSTTTSEPPTEPGEYTQTAVVGGNYQTANISRSFTITG